MKKTPYIILSLLLLVGAIFVIGNNSSRQETLQEETVMTPDTSLESVTPTLVTIEESTSEESTLVESIELETKEIDETRDSLVVSFRDITYLRTPEGFMFRGRVYTTPDTNVEGMSIELICEGVPITNMISDSTGLFEANGVCNANDEAYARVTNDGITYESKHIKLAKSVSRSASLTAATTSGVPEFSLLTIGIAVAITALGLVYLRKN